MTHVKIVFAIRKDGEMNAGDNPARGVLVLSYFGL